MSEKLNYDDVVEKLNEDGIMQEPDANWIIEYIGSEYGGNIDNTSEWLDNKHDLKIYDWQKSHQPNLTGTDKAYYPNKNKDAIDKKYKTWKS